MTENASEGGETAISDPQRPELSSDPLAPDEMYRALASPTRRRVLYHLLEDGRKTVEELLDVLAGERAPREETVVTPSDREATEIELVHADLPMLAEADLVDYDPVANAVELRDLHAFVATTIRRAYRYNRAVVEGQ